MGIRRKWVKYKDIDNFFMSTCQLSEVKRKQNVYLQETHKCKSYVKKKFILIKDKQ